MRIFTLSLLIIISTHTFAEESSTFKSKLLSHTLANKAVTASVEECNKRGYKVSAAITGRQGNLVAFLRHPLSGPHTIRVSQKKAFTASSLQAVTGKQLQKDRPDLNFAPGILIIQGALPINIAGYFYGGIAVAGADTQTDEDCAKKGLEVLAEVLEFD